MEHSIYEPDFLDHVKALTLELWLRDDSTFLQSRGCTVSYPESDAFAQLFSVNDTQVYQLFHDGIIMIRSSGVNVMDGPFDPVGTLVSASLIDAANIVQGKIQCGGLSQAPLADPRNNFARLLADTCAVHHLPGGRKAYVATKSGKPLFLAGALGVPAFFWAQFLADQAHGWKPILVELRCGNLLEGGMATDQSLVGHAEDLAEALRVLSPGPGIAVGWCNAGRVAVALAHVAPEMVEALVLLGTTFRGIAGIMPRPSPFEDNLDRLFRDLIRKPAQASFATRMIRNISHSAALETTEDAWRRRFPGVARKGTADALIAPMRRPVDLLNFAKRSALDEAHDTATMLRETVVPTLALTGDNDGIINTAVTRDAIAMISGSRHIEIRGAGHYLHDLQYRYVKEIIQRFLSDPTGDLTSGRMRLADLHMA